MPPKSQEGEHPTLAPDQPYPVCNPLRRSFNKHFSTGYIVLVAWTSSTPQILLDTGGKILVRYGGFNPNSNNTVQLTNDNIFNVVTKAIGVTAWRGLGLQEIASASDWNNKKEGWGNWVKQQLERANIHLDHEEDMFASISDGTGAAKWFGDSNSAVFVYGHAYHDLVRQRYDAYVEENNLTAPRYRPSQKGKLAHDRPARPSAGDGTLVKNPRRTTTNRRSTAQPGSASGRQQRASEQVAVPSPRPNKPRNYGSLQLFDGRQERRTARVETIQGYRIRNDADAATVRRLRNPDPNERDLEGLAKEGAVVFKKHYTAPALPAEVIHDMMKSSLKNSQDLKLNTFASAVYEGYILGSTDGEVRGFNGDEGHRYQAITPRAWDEHHPSSQLNTQHLSLLEGETLERFQESAEAVLGRPNSKESVLRLSDLTVIVSEMARRDCKLAIVLKEALNLHAAIKCAADDDGAIHFALGSPRLSMNLKYLNIATLLPQQAPDAPILRLLSLLLYRQAAKDGGLDPSITFVDYASRAVVTWDEQKQCLRTSHLGNAHSTFVMLLPFGGTKWAAVHVHREARQYTAKVLESGLYHHAEPLVDSVNRFLKAICSHAAEDRSVWVNREYEVVVADVWGTDPTNAGVFALCHLRRLLTDGDIYEPIDDIVERQGLGRALVNAMEPMPRFRRLSDSEWRTIVLEARKDRFRQMA